MTNFNYLINIRYVESNKSHSVINITECYNVYTL